MFNKDTNITLLLRNRKRPVKLGLYLTGNKLPSTTLVQMQWEKLRLG